MKSALVWFRRDLRDNDHAALAAALAEAGEVHCAFVFDTRILDALPDRCDRRVAFIHAALLELDGALRQRGGGLVVLHGDARWEIPALAQRLGVDAVFANRDYEPAAKERDSAVATALAATGRSLHLFRDQVVFDGDAVLTQAGQPFTVYTPYRNAWLKRLMAGDLAAHDCRHGQYAASGEVRGVPALGAIGFEPEALNLPTGMRGARELFEAFKPRLADYRAQRDYPAVRGVSYLSAHLRFGTISVRELARDAWQRDNEGARTWLGELIWRDFYFAILDRFPHVVGASFRPACDAIVWDDWPEGFAAWCEGRTGYPLVDAAMRQLRATGYMHNRLRMVSAAFLTKDLGVDWHKGEAWFARQLMDFDLAANNGGWQWAASTGCDAQPWFRIFNPVTQSEKFDPEGIFIRRYVPELERVAAKWVHAPWRMPPAEQALAGLTIGRDYPGPIVDHARARESTLARYAVAKKAGG